jgi:hypothetical protein
LDESWFYLWTSHEPVWVQSDQQPPEMMKHMIGVAKWWLQLSGIHKISTLLTRFQKARNLMQIIISTESYNHFWRVAQLGVAQVLSFMWTMRGPTSLKKLSNFAGKIASKWRPIHHTHRT